MPIHLPRWVSDKIGRQKSEEDRQKSQQLEQLRARAAKEASWSEQQSTRGVVGREFSHTRKPFIKHEARRRAKRVRLARRGKSIHNFRIHR